MNQENAQSTAAESVKATPSEPQLQVIPPVPGIQVAFGVQTGPLPPQVLQQITAEHITQLLASEDRKTTLQHEFALKQLDAQADDRQNQRKTDDNHHRNELIFGGAVLVFVSGFTWLGFWYGQTDIIKIIVPAILAFGAGFVAGKGYQNPRQ